MRSSEKNHYCYISEKQKGNMDIRSFTGQGVKTGGKTSATESKPPSDPDSKKNPGQSSKPSLFNAGVKKTVQGFGETKNDKTETIKSREDGPNIHGFGRLQPGEDSDESAKTTGGGARPKQVFSGGGNSLGGRSKTGDVRPAGPIVRRIPGIGVITSERFSQVEGSSYNNGASCADGVIETTNSNSDQELVESVDEILQNGDTNTGPKAVIDYNSDESDFDDFLDGLLKPVFKKQKKKKDKKHNGDIPKTGSNKRIPGFTSVSNRRNSDPRKRYSNGSGPTLPKVTKTRRSDEFLHSGSTKSEQVNSPEWKTKVRARVDERDGQPFDFPTASVQSDGKPFDIPRRTKPSATVTRPDCPAEIPSESSVRTDGDNYVIEGRVPRINNGGGFPFDSCSSDNTNERTFPSQTVKESSEKSSQNSSNVYLPNIIAPDNVINKPANPAPCPSNVLPNSKPTSKRKLPNDFAVDRYKRAAHGLSSDSDSDIDENMTLGSVINRNVQKPPTEASTKRPRFSSTDDVMGLNPIASPQPGGSIYQNRDMSASAGSNLPNPTNPQSGVEQEPAMISCPVCRIKVPEWSINDHLDSCLLSPDF